MSYQLTLEPLGATIEVEEGQTILDAALRQGIYIPHACGHGLCGTCKVTIESGEVDHGAANPFALLDFERDEGKTLACCATLQADTTIEADIDEDPDAEIIPVQDFQSVVSRVVDLTPTIKAIYLKLDKPLHFQAGQYVQLQVPGVEGGGGAEVFDAEVSSLLALWSAARVHSPLRPLPHLLQGASPARDDPGRNEVELVTK